MPIAPPPVQKSQQPFPLLDAPLVDPETGIVGEAWYRFFISLWRRGTSPGGKPQPLVVTSNPFIYGPAPITGSFLSDGGILQVSRDGGQTWITADSGGGNIRLLVGDFALVAWTSTPPTVVWLPDST